MRKRTRTTGRGLEDIGRPGRLFADVNHNRYRANLVLGLFAKIEWRMGELCGLCRSLLYAGTTMTIWRSRHATTRRRTFFCSLEKVGLLPICVLFASLVFTGCRATPPSKGEGKVVNWTKHHVTIHGKKDVNPFQATEDNLAEGKDTFTSYCMVCHGLDGQNTGVPFAATISPPVPSLASPEVQAYSDGQLRWIIKNGIWPSGMPPSNGEFSDREMWEMVLYIRHLPKAGSLGAPKVYGGLSK